MAIVAVFNAKMELAGLYVLLAIVADFFDGFAARALKAYSELGKQLDSLADMVSFGVVPGMILFTLFYMGSSSSEADENLLLAGQYSMFIVTLFSALRLAKFNIDPRQASYFIGLPTPANALMIISFPLILSHDEFGLSTLIYHPLFLILFAVVSAFLLIAEIPLIALKFKSFDLKSNKGPYFLLTGSILLGIVFRYAAPPLIIVFYVILSLILPPDKLKR
jgi:CDP-diacylglycerol--serine O-phosphatidyltransferase